MTAEAIIVENVSKRFNLRHTRSLKETVVWLFKGRRGDHSSTFMELDKVDVRVGVGESVALLGFNGSGKSTLLKLISGVMSTDTGSVKTRGKVAGLIEVGAGFHPDLTGRENVFLNGVLLGMSEKETEARFDEIVEFSEIGKFIDTEVKFYSSGMFLRLAFSVAVHTNPDVFLIDEILSVGDEPFQKKCLARIQELRESGCTLVVVSHDLDMVRKVCDRGVVLRQGKKVADGPISEAVSLLREG